MQMVPQTSNTSMSGWGQRRRFIVCQYEASGWNGIGAPRNTPAEIVEKLNREINAGLAEPKLITHLSEQGATAFANSPADFGRFIADETVKWGNVIRAANLHAD